MGELVSICWTTHHEPIEMIQKSLDSINNQSYDNIEVIMVDDCSIVEGVSEFLDYYAKSHTDKNFIHIKLPVNVGFARAKNIGTAAAKGKYFMFMDADQELMGNVIMSAVEYFETDSVSVGWSILHNDTKDFYIPRYKYILYSEDIWNKVPDIYFGIGTCLFKTDIFNCIGYFNPSINYSDSYFFLIQMYKYMIDNNLKSVSIFDENIYTIDYKDYNRNSCVIND